MLHKKYTYKNACTRARTYTYAQEKKKTFTYKNACIRINRKAKRSLSFSSSRPLRVYMCVNQIKRLDIWTELICRMPLLRLNNEINEIGSSFLCSLNQIHIEFCKHFAIFFAFSRKNFPFLPQYEYSHSHSLSLFSHISSIYFEMYASFLFFSFEQLRGKFGGNGRFTNWFSRRFYGNYFYNRLAMLVFTVQHWNSIFVFLLNGLCVYPKVQLQL